MNNNDPYKILYPPPHLCECNCGLITAPGKRFIHSHYFKTKEFKEKQSECVSLRMLINNPMKNPKSVSKMIKSNTDNGHFEECSIRFKGDGNPSKKPENRENARKWMNELYLKGNPAYEKESQNKRVETNKKNGNSKKFSKTMTERNLLNNPMSNPVSVEKANDTRRKNGFYERTSVRMIENNPMHNSTSLSKMVRTLTENGTYESRRLALTDMDFFLEHGVHKSSYPYPDSFNRRKRILILKRWSNRCVITGLTNEECKQLYGQGLHIHHWNYDKTTEDEYWMIPVCPSINHMANFDKESWMSLFGGIVEEKVPLWTINKEASP